MEPSFTEKNTSPLKEVLQGAAPSGGEQPGANSNAAAGKARVRYSGAARRRYKKQMQKERAAQAPPDALINTLKDEGGDVPVLSLIHI